MLDKFCSVRKEHGGTFATVFEDGLIVPWRLLTMQEYVSYTRDLASSPVPQCYIEDEIFVKCVLDDSLVRRIDYLHAGVVQNVVQNIWQYSGPLGIDAFNEDLNAAREEVNESSLAIIHDLVSLVTSAFPYTPEQVYAMDYSTFLIRVAQAEKKLIQYGQMKEPVTLIDRSAIGKRQRPKIDPKKLFDLQHKQKPSTPVEPEELPSGKWYKESPVLEAPSPKKIDFDLERMEAETFGTTSGWDLVDREIQRDQMVKDAKVIYKDLLKKMEERKSKPKG